MKRVTLYLTEYDSSLQKWHAWLLSPLELPYCSQSKINSFNLFQGPYLQIETSGNPYSGLKRPSQSFQIQKHPKVLVLLEEEYSEKCLVPTVTFMVVKLLYRDEWVLKVWGELCFINAVMNSHTTVWWNTKTWNRRCYPPLIPCIIGHFFQHDNEDIHSPKVKILQWTCI